MRFTRRSTAALTAALGTTVALGLSVVTPAATATPQGMAPAAPTDLEADEADEAVAAAADDALEAVQTEVADVPDPVEEPGRDATLLLTDLATHLDDLGPSERRTAHRYLARPTGGGDDLGGFVVRYNDGLTVQDDCGAGEPGQASDFCVSWVNSSGDAPSTADANGTADGDGVPDYVERVRTSMQHVWDAEVDDLGYQAPLGDGTPGPGTDKLDIYLADIGDPGYYGYCTPERQVGGAWAYAGYCVLDDDYAEFPSNTPVENLQVTAAHEFFHAVQFGYDAGEDSWFMEGSAAWMEDEVYDGVNDNYQYLRSSPLSHPGRPLDHSASIGVYGSWIWWRYLSESYGAGVVRAVWNRADDSDNPAGTRDSMKAVAAELAGRGTTLRSVFGQFGSDNRAPALFYEEGAAYDDVATPRAAKSWTLTSGDRTSGFRVVELDHMTYATVAVKPGSGLLGGWRLRVDVDAPPQHRQPFARVVAYRPGGAVEQSRVLSLDQEGNGKTTVVFDSADVARVDVTLTNAGHAFNCWEGTQYSCLGKPKDDNQDFRYKVTALQP